MTGIIGLVLTTRILFKLAGRDSDVFWLGSYSVVWKMLRSACSPASQEGGSKATATSAITQYTKVTRPDLLAGSANFPNNI
jgi:hypothetical protein